MTPEGENKFSEYVYEGSFVRSSQDLEFFVNNQLYNEETMQGQDRSSRAIGEKNNHYSLQLEEDLEGEDGGTKQPKLSTHTLPRHERQGQENLIEEESKNMIFNR